MACRIWIADILQEERSQREHMEEDKKEYIGQRTLDGCKETSIG